MTRVAVRPEMLRWAYGRAGFDLEDLAHEIPHLPAWERGEKLPTLKQLERLREGDAHTRGLSFSGRTSGRALYRFRTYAPSLTRRSVPSKPRPARHSVPLSAAPGMVPRLRPNHGRNAAAVRQAPLLFTHDVVQIAATIRRALAFDLEERRQMPTWTDALRQFIEQADALRRARNGQRCGRQQQPAQARSAGVPWLRTGR